MIFSGLRSRVKKISVYSFAGFSFFTLIASFYVPVAYGPGLCLVAISSPLLVLGPLNHLMGVQWLLPNKREKNFLLSIALGCISGLLLTPILAYWLGSLGAVLSVLTAEAIVFLALDYQVRKINVVHK